MNAIGSGIRELGSACVSAPCAIASTIASIFTAAIEGLCYVVKGVVNFVGFFIEYPSATVIICLATLFGG